MDNGVPKNRTLMRVGLRDIKKKDESAFISMNELHFLSNKS